MIKVVIIEDEKHIRQGLILTTPWEELGCKVVGEGKNALEGIEIIKEKKPDIVITDIRMPQKNGLEMIKELEIVTSCEYIIISGYEEFEYAKEAVTLGVCEYLLKPIDDAELLRALEKAIAAVNAKNKKTDSDGETETEYNLFNTVIQLEGGVKGKYVERALKYIKMNCMSDVTMKDVADSLYISESYMGKLLKAKTNATFLELLTLFRMKRAVKFLDETDKKVYEIALMLGYRDTRYFSHLFRKIVGVKPTEYKEKVRDKKSFE